MTEHPPHDQCNVCGHDSAPHVINLHGYLQSVCQKCYEKHQEKRGKPIREPERCSFCGVDIATIEANEGTQINDMSDEVDYWWCCEDHWKRWVRAVRQDPDRPDPKNGDWFSTDPRAVDDDPGTGTAADRGDR
jgi:hypothetical protein